ncbi:helix-turn-helix transcriptional regulator [Aestuariicella hydrocarbonica]|uniref:Helix-turn-helix transcriptional regulator n=1 Tax=Pseudomaricurvus hydrocarbonicus TaxID=1470433 RepID=A0A9E5JQJ4_9GAMM|nr:helix-turn-helix transcriptional regulator [Aestuariicella hydrocarbonica]NHO64649.1 helix-turn-helix transcriptional regulator [Aestuariicella hydrocarbonica]
MKLAPRQKEALELTSKGLMQREIAEIMQCSIDNVRNLMSACYFKLHARNAAEAVAKAMQQGLIHFVILVAVLMGAGMGDQHAMRQRSRINQTARIVRLNRELGGTA